MGKRVGGWVLPAGKRYEKQQPERMAKQCFAILPGFYPAVYQMHGAAADNAGLRAIWRLLSDQAPTTTAAGRNPRNPFDYSEWLISFGLRLMQL